ncbi:hypothetical protein IP65_18635 [Novosphingobium sp. AAP1]|uniref:hypothetical protein n=1 Tax=Novosphingobium sp. AAP1 TaxID=1523413 RepID=UPI0006B9B01D|nr:hypothetical protein [Novosphingobium sp. AAP1]KPF51938.1 hypothetical protein IP65_18635 [Novosphingobium sp. AAP1]
MRVPVVAPANHGLFPGMRRGAAQLEPAPVADHAGVHADRPGALVEIVADRELFAVVGEAKYRLRVAVITAGADNRATPGNDLMAKAVLSQLVEADQRLHSPSTKSPK